MNLFRSAINDDNRAQLFAQLATLENAGISLLQALPIAIEQLPAAMQPALQRLQRYVQSGKPLGESGQLSGALLPWEVSLISTGEQAGRLQAVLARLQAYYAARSRRRRRLRGRLVYPAVLVVLALFISPLPSLILGKIGIGGYLTSDTLTTRLVISAQPGAPSPTEVGRSPVARVYCQMYLAFPESVVGACGLVLGLLAGGFAVGSGEI